jgi:hypothetical protein
METYKLEDLENTWGIGPGFMKTFSGIDRSSGKKDIPGEIDMERARYLLSLDNMLEEMLNDA